MKITKTILMLVFLVCLVPSVFAEWCYQETANVSTPCGGLNTGTYSWTNESWTGIFLINYTKPLNAVSADWMVKAGVINASHPEHAVSINYTLSDNCFNQNPIQLKMIQISSGMSDDAFRTAEYCYNGTDWEVVYDTGVTGSNFAGGADIDSFWQLFDGNWSNGAWFDKDATWNWHPSQTVTNPAGNLLYEEAMWWNITLTPPVPGPDHGYGIYGLLSEVGAGSYFLISLISNPLFYLFILLILVAIISLIGMSIVVLIRKYK